MKRFRTSIARLRLLGLLCWFWRRCWKSNPLIWVPEIVLVQRRAISMPDVKPGISACTRWNELPALCFQCYKMTTKCWVFLPSNVGISCWYGLLCGERMKEESRIAPNRSTQYSCRELLFLCNQLQVLRPASHDCHRRKPSSTVGFLPVIGTVSQ